MHDRTEWTRGETGNQTIRGKAYKNLTEFSRPCAACGKLFSIFVTTKIANGHADSNSFGLKNCEEHRRNKSAVDTTEVDALRTANVTMREELAGLYVLNKEQFEELQVCKAKLAQYELPAAMAAQAEGVTTPMVLLDSAANLYGSAAPCFTHSNVIGCEAVQNTTNGVLPAKMPWE